MVRVSVAKGPLICINIGFLSLPLNKHVCINTTMVKVSVAKGPLHWVFRVFFFITGITCSLKVFSEFRLVCFPCAQNVLQSLVETLWVWTYIHLVQPQKLTRTHMDWSLGVINKYDFMTGFEKKMLETLSL